MWQTSEEVTEAQFPKGSLQIFVILIPSVWQQCSAHINIPDQQMTVEENCLW